MSDELFEERDDSLALLTPSATANDFREGTRAFGESGRWKFAGEKR